MTPKESISRILAPAVGEERASELIDERARAVLGTSGVLTDKDADALLRSFAAAAASGNVVPLAVVSSMLESALGAEKAHAVVAETAARLGVHGDTCTRTQANRIFEELAAMEGLVGVTARFAKARFLLRIG